jgi:hypothetical protein
VAELEVSVDQPVAMLAVRLSDIAPDGAATRVSYGLLNLTHRDGHDDPQPARPGERYRVRVALNGVAQTFPAGHRIRLALSTSYWPLAWPPPHPVRLSLHPGASSLSLPVRPGTATAADDRLRPLGLPEGAPAAPTTQVRPGEQRWTVSRDLVEYRSELEVLKDGGITRFDDIDLEAGKHVYECYRWTGDDLASPEGETVWTMTFTRGGWSVRTVTRQLLTCTPTEFRLHAQLDAYEGDHRVHSDNWDIAVARDLL